ncbi:GGDEF domain-containing response regulator [Alteromonas sp. KUL150]|uniref:GGDEF domain-containing response regulator n=1 Tax=Alteromonas sp. KUL150 TaxID=2480805 RepID=UPI001330B221|nr:diguanylate cyclase [Alteromonas sp. KUL150]
MIKTLISQHAAFDESDMKRCRVLIVDDDEISALVVSTMLAKTAITEFLCKSTLVLEKCVSMQPDLILLDVNMPVKNGLEVCKELKASPATEDIPVMFMTGNVEHSAQEACWKAGATDFIVKPILAMTLVHRVRNILMNGLRMKFLSQVSFRDQLTGLCNRHYLNTEVNAALKSAARSGKPFSVIVIDIDLFKSYNDTYGHLAGDTCLVAVAKAIKSSVQRPSDIVIRFGGEEFVVALPDTDVRGVKLVASRILENVEALHIENLSSPGKRVTVSAGYAGVSTRQLTTLDSIINQADLALFEAKQAGRNTLRGFDDYSLHLDE